MGVGEDNHQHDDVAHHSHQEDDQVAKVHQSLDQREEDVRNSRINKMLIAMVVIFGACWFPINLINLAADTIDLGELAGEK